MSTKIIYKTKYILQLRTSVFFSVYLKPGESTTILSPEVTIMSNLLSAVRKQDLIPSVRRLLWEEAHPPKAKR